MAYDLRGYPTALRAPVLSVSLPGAGAAAVGRRRNLPLFPSPLTATNGTVNVPVAALAGGNLHDLDRHAAGHTGFNSDISDLAFTRVDAGTARPPAPLLSLPHDTAPR